MATRPTRYPDWATGGGAVVVQPTAAKILAGWVNQEKPPAGFLNDQQNLNAKWERWLNERRTIAATWGATIPAIGGGSPVHMGEFGLTWTGTAPTLTDASAAYGSAFSVWTMTNNAEFNQLATDTRMVFPSASYCGVLVADAALSNVGANDVTAQISIQNLTGANFGGAMFKKASTDTNWQCVTNDGAASTTTDSGVPPVANTFQRFEIRAYGVTRVEFYIDNVIVATNTTHINTTLAMLPSVYSVSTNNTAHTFKVGAVSFSW